jgi:hypothetical protein
MTFVAKYGIGDGSSDSDGGSDSNSNDGGTGESDGDNKYYSIINIISILKRVTAIINFISIVNDRRRNNYQEQQSTH